MSPGLPRLPAIVTVQVVPAVSTRHGVMWPTPVNSPVSGTVLPFFSLPQHFFPQTSKLNFDVIRSQKPTNTPLIRLYSPEQQQTDPSHTT